MTLQEWISNGGCALSNYTAYRLCKHNDLAESQLRAMPLLDIFALRTIPADMHEGKHLSERELIGFWRDCPNQLIGKARQFAHDHLNT